MNQGYSLSRIKVIENSDSKSNLLTQNFPTILDIFLVEVNLIVAKLFHTTITTDLHYNMHTFIIFAVILIKFDFVIH
jgi:hypothetical protein